MKKFIDMFVALVLSVAFVTPIMAQVTSSSVPLRGQPFFKGLESPGELADLIDANIKKNSSGRTKLDAKACRTPGNGSCARPIDYLETVKEADPIGTVHLKTVADLPAFLRTLREEPAPSGRYVLACLRPIGGGNYKAVLGCTDRPFKLGESIWVNPVSNRPLFASDCTNPIKGPAPKETACAEIHLFARAGDTVARNAVGGGTAFQDDCFAIKKAGESEFHSPWKDECASEHCVFEASEIFLKKKMWMIASYELEPGEYVLRVPASFAQKDSSYVTVLCLERTKMAWPEFPPEKYTLAQRNEYGRLREQWIAGHSDSVNVWWNAYRVGSDGVPRATIYYTQAEVPPTETVEMYWRWGVWAQEHPTR